MYEMYPEAWPVTAHRPSESAEAKPRRRARKAHSVTPVVLGQADASKAAHAA